MNFMQEYAAFVRSLPPGQQAFVRTFMWSLAILTVLMIWNRINQHRRGGGPRRGNKKIEFIICLLGFCGLYYAQSRTPWLAEFLSWPSRHFQMWRNHGQAMFWSFILAGYVAKGLAALYAALFLRSGGRSQSGGGIVVGSSPFNLLPDPPPGYGWFSEPKPRTRIIGKRTRTTYEEE